ncbi:MAG: sulfite exporter TauE/SafE family protein, partial [Caldilineales bacterium]|nr:sulfite exporter TauE/SafE family protein [Caldilineales bacterium]
MSDSSATYLVIISLVVFMIGLSKGGLGGTMGALATPLLALIMPANEVIGLLLPVLMYADVFAVALHWRRWDRRLVILLVPASLIGVIVGTFFLNSVSPTTLKLVLGIITLLFAAYRLLEQHIHNYVNYKPRSWHGYVAGGVAGFSSSIAHNGGPPVSIYLLLQDVTPRVFIGTSAIFFLILNWLKVPFYWQAGLFDANALMGVLLPVLILVPVGVWLG